MHARRLLGFMLLVLELAMISHWIILISFISFLFHFTFKYQHFYVRWEGENIHAGQNAHHCFGQNAHICRYILWLCKLVSLPQSCDYCDTEYFKSIYNNYMEMQVIFVINFIRVDKAIHWNGNVLILMKFSSLAALKVVKMTTYSAASDENFVKMTTFSFQCRPM